MSQSDPIRGAGAARMPFNPVIVWLGLFLFVVLGTNVSGHSWFSLYRLAQDGRTATATTTRAHTSDHDGCEYVFSVSGRSYRGSRESCGDRRVGDPLTVTYLPQQPEVNSAYSPASQLAKDIAFATILPTVIVAFVGWRSRRAFRPRP